MAAPQQSRNNAMPSSSNAIGGLPMPANVARPAFKSAAQPQQQFSQQAHDSIGNHSSAPNYPPSHSDDTVRPSEVDKPSQKSSDIAAAFSPAQETSFPASSRKGSGVAAVADVSQKAGDPSGSGSNKGILTSLQKGFLGFLYPNARVVDPLPDGNEMYFDKVKNKWIFPGQVYSHTSTAFSDD